MKKVLVPTATLALAMALVTSTAAALSTGNLALDVQSATGSGGHVDVNVSGGTATLSGYVDNEITAQRVLRAVRDHAEIQEVIDHMSHR